jgi:hypothetical protein
MLHMAFLSKISHFAHCKIGVREGCCHVATIQGYSKKTVNL